MILQLESVAMGWRGLGLALLIFLIQTSQEKHSITHEFRPNKIGDLVVATANEQTQSNPEDLL